MEVDGTVLSNPVISVLIIIRGFAKIRGCLLGVLVITASYFFGGLYQWSPIFVTQFNLMRVLKWVITTPIIGL